MVSYKFAAGLGKMTSRCLWHISELLSMVGKIPQDTGRKLATVTWCAMWSARYNSYTPNRLLYTSNYVEMRKSKVAIDFPWSQCRVASSLRYRSNMDSYTPNRLLYMSNDVEMRKSKVAIDFPWSQEEWHRPNSDRKKWLNFSPRNGS